MTEAEKARQAIELLKPGLHDQGYTVYFEPGGQFLPPSIGSYRPDAVAIGPSDRKKLAFEVVSEGSVNQGRITELSARFDQIDGWELRVIYIRPQPIEDFRLPSSASSIEASIAAVNRLREEGQLSPALLMGWATTEALGRSLMPARFTRPLKPSSVVTALAEEGWILPTEANFLRELATIRNQLIHGNLDTVVSEEAVERFVGILQDLFTLSKSTDPSARSGS